MNPKNARLEAWTSAKYARISQLLDDALELAPEAREGWLADLDIRDGESAREIRALLRPGADRIERILTGAEEVIASVPEVDGSLVGRQFGPYRVYSLLGHGGMGSVWLAERVDGLLERRVALKLVPPALMGLGFAERLARERTILASLDHPNIARLYDAGLSADGQSYLALEYVPGAPFVAYCDQRRLSVPDRLELFRQVLKAVQYAHAHLVIHRDLKPANILVTEEGRACLLDFGIAKLLRESVANETELTQLRGRALSPKYAAPEQIAGGPITIAADIYALGVLLYELLTGEGPYRPSRPSTGALEEAILASEIVPPSRVALTESAADARAARPRGLARMLRGDLDTIVAKALRKSPTERYATADALAEDIARWLHGEPVLARRQSLAYRAVKFTRRHWLGVAVAAAFVLAIGAGLAAATYEARVATVERDAALQAQLRSLTQTAAARLRDGDAAGAMGIILEVLRHPGMGGADGADALAVFQEARAADSQVLAFGGRTPEMSSLDVSPDGHRVATASSDGAIRIWDAETGRELGELRIPAEQYHAIFSPDGGRILTRAHDHTLRIWSAATLQPLIELKGHTDAGWNAMFSADGRRVVSASLDKTARVWDATTGRELLRLRHDDKVIDAEFSPDGRRVITGAHDLIARVWDVATGREVLELVGHEEQVTVATYSPDGSQILTATAGPDSPVRLWDAATGRLRLLLAGHSDAVSGAHFSRDGRRIVTASADRTARIWDAAYGRQIAVLTHPDQVWSAAFSPDGRFVATSSADRTARLWDVATDRDSVLVVSHPQQLAAAAFSPDGGRILTASYDRTAAVWDARTGQRLTTLRGHADRLWGAAFSPDGRRIVTASRDRTARVWDLATGRELLRLSGHAGAIERAAFSRDGQRLATASYDRTARIWDASSGQELLRLAGHSDGVSSAAFSSDSRRVITASADRSARIWDAATGRELLRLEGARGLGTAAFSPDGRRVVTASDDGTARIWDAATGRELIQLRGHKGGVSDAEFSPDGKRIVTASQDRTVRLWDAETGRAIALYPGHDGEIRTVAFSPDGRRIVSASADGTARVWDARPATIEQQLVWAEAAQFDELSSLDRLALGLPGAARLQQIAKSHEPDRIARLGAEADEAAFRAATAADRNAHFLEAFRLFAAAAARARDEGWPDESWSSWRHRRASLARLLARAGMMAEVSDAYERIRGQSAPPSPSVWERMRARIGAD